jgi:hypothetical protein
VSGECLAAVQSFVWRRFGDVPWAASEEGRGNRSEHDRYPSRPANGPQPKAFALHAKVDIAGSDGTVLAGAVRAAPDAVGKRPLRRNEPDKLLHPARNRGAIGRSTLVEQRRFESRRGRGPNCGLADLAGGARTADAEVP